MVIFFYFSAISIHLHSLQVENCDSNSRLVVNEDDNGKFRPERVKENFKLFTHFKTSSEWKLMLVNLTLEGLKLIG